ncbi:unnamed protein product [Cutaneotrichosporon oleaginosum]
MPANMPHSLSAAKLSSESSPSRAILLSPLHPSLVATSPSQSHLFLAHLDFLPLSPQVRNTTAQHPPRSANASDSDSRAANREPSLNA